MGGGGPQHFLIKSLFPTLTLREESEANDEKIEGKTLFQFKCTTKETYP